MKMLSKKGSALMQVLLVTAVLAGLATLLLRASISRTSSAHQVKRNISAQLMVESCMAQVQTVFAKQDPEMFIKNMKECMFNCNATDAAARTAFYNNPDPSVLCPENKQQQYTCSLSENDTNHNVVAVMSQDANGKCQITYTIDSAGNL